MKDDVIILFEKVKKNLQDSMDFQIVRRDAAKKNSVDGVGRVRPSFAHEAAVREIEIQQLQALAEDAQGRLQHAIDDLPRRDGERKKAAELELQAQARDQKAASLLELLRTEEQEADTLRQKARHALELASKTLNELNEGQAPKERKVG